MEVLPQNWNGDVTLVTIVVITFDQYTLIIK
ncbi:hypothetical protein Glo7428_4168 [Gloeocapsa sp. PCC 7428]|nr:hypothetical protein Glo7428_4168 [Gloeocapsa sp. PCC 7428]